MVDAVHLRTCDQPGEGAEMQAHIEVDEKLPCAKDNGDDALVLARRYVEWKSKPGARPEKLGTGNSLQWCRVAVVTFMDSSLW